MATVHGYTVAVHCSTSHRRYAEVMKAIAQKLREGKQRGIACGFKWYTV